MLRSRKRNMRRICASPEKRTWVKLTQDLWCHATTRLSSGLRRACPSDTWEHGGAVLLASVHKVSLIKSQFVVGA